MILNHGTGQQLETKMSNMYYNFRKIHIPLLLFAAGFMLYVTSPITALAQEGESGNPLSAEELDAINRGVFLYRAQSATCSVGSGASASLTGSDNHQKAFLYFIGKGLSPEQSAGIVGNLDAESGVNPINEENGQEGKDSGGKGLAQWTAGRRVSFEGAAKAAGVITREAEYESLLASDPAAAAEAMNKAMQFNLDYLWSELEGPYKKVLDEIRVAGTLQEASNIILLKFEIPKNKGPDVQAERASRGQKVIDLYGGDVGTVIPAGAAGAACKTGPNGSAAAFVGFPLLTTKAEMEAKNKGQFVDGKMNEGGHPYAAHDIIAATGTPVVSIYSGQVVSISQDKCPGRLVSIYSPDQGATVSYLHLSLSQTLVAKGDSVQAGQTIGFVGSSGEGCGTPHLHIDAAEGDDRPGCRRENCPAANQAIFRAGSNKINLPGQLFDTYMKLP